MFSTYTIVQMHVGLKQNGRFHVKHVKQCPISNTLGTASVFP